MKIDEIALWEAFQAVALQGNFSKASRTLKTGVPQVSKRIGKLENLLGVRLFQRSTRVVKLTADGQALLPKVNSLLDDWVGLESSFENKLEISGTLRIASIPFVAQHLLLPVITAFQKKHPQVHFDFDLSERMLNLLESNIDLAFRIDDEPKDTSLIYRKLAENKLVFCASPLYLRKNPRPIRSPRDLKHHEILMLELHRDCVFTDQSPLHQWVPTQKITCENGGFLTDLALRGHGILLRSLIDVQDHLLSGKLVQVLKNHPLENFGNLYAIIPTRRLLAPRVRAFLDAVVAKSETWHN